MTTLLLDREATLEADLSQVRCTSRGRLTLEELISGVWEGLAANETVACPVCDGRMAPRPGAGPGSVGGGCPSCGSHLS
jgi:DnaJ-class molecular chaperone